MSKELTKEEILSARIGTYGFTKLELSKPIICPIEALDAMQEYSDQNTKPLIDEINKLKAQFEQSDKMYSDLLAKKDYFKLNWKNSEDRIKQLQSDLKAAESVNEGLSKSHDELLKIAKHYIKNHDYIVIANADKLTRNNK